MNIRGFASIHLGKGLASVTFADTVYNNPSHAFNVHQKCLDGKLRNKVFSKGTLTLIKRLSSQN